MFFYHTGNLYFAEIFMGVIRLSIRFMGLSAVLVFSLSSAPAQFYNMGQNPGRLKWEQILTDHFKVIYPKQFRQEAFRMTHLLDSYYESNSAYLDHRPGPIPVVLHNQSVLSNGFVAWAPKRMELVTTPSATSHSQDHFEQLALHEFRHVVQVDKMKQGFTKGLSYFAGEAGVGAVTGFMPFWFLEGDATDAETRLSYSGRGRLPSFEMEIKAILAEVPGLYHYEKAVYGSYKDYIPNHYQYGYQMVSHARNKYGNQLWSDVLNYTARKPYTLYPNYFALKKYAGLSKTELYEETFKTLRTHWNSQEQKRTLTPYQSINTGKKRHFTSYRFPRYLDNGLVFAEKSGIDQISEFVTIDSEGREKRLHRPGFYNPASISAAANKIVWAEYMWDPRWERRSYSVIKVFDLALGSERILSLRTRYFAPDVSSDGRMIVAIELDELNRYFLVVLDEKNGSVLKKVQAPDNEFLQYPVWNDDNSKVYLTALGGKGKRILSYDLEKGDWATHFDAGFENIAELDCGDEYLVFRGSFSGIDNIYALDLQTNHCKRVTSARFGAFTPGLSANGDTLLYADYSSQGYNIVKTSFDPSAFVSLEELSGHSEQLNLPGPEEEKQVPRPGPAGEDYTALKYRKIGNLFRFHSWAPFYTDIDDPSIEEVEVNPGLMLVSQNMLSTATTVLGYEYNLERRDHFLHASFTWAGWYPVIRVGVDYGGIPVVGPAPDTSSLLSKVRTDLRTRTRVYIPLNLTSNRFVMGARPSLEASHSRTYFYYDEPEAYRSGLTFMDYRLNYYTYLKKAKRDILPRLGLVIDLRYVDTPFENEQLGSQVSGSGTVYLPGALRHQTLRLSAGAQKQDPRNFPMGNSISMPRGILNYTAVELWKLSFDYVFPIAYPDWQVWRAAFFQRFRGSIFFDYAEGKDVYLRGNNPPVNKSFQSYGLELSTDVHLAQVLVPFNIGGRLIYVPETGETTGEFVFSVNLNQF
jgi:hypothetical protein